MKTILDFAKMKKEGRKLSMATCDDAWSARILQGRKWIACSWATAWRW